MTIPKKRLISGTAPSLDEVGGLRSYAAALR